MSVKIGRLTQADQKQPHEIGGWDAFVICSATLSSHIVSPANLSSELGDLALKKRKKQSLAFRQAGVFSLPIDVIGFGVPIYLLEALQNYQTGVHIRCLISRPMHMIRLEVKGALMSMYGWHSLKWLLFFLRWFTEHRWQGRREKLGLTVQPWHHNDYFFSVGKKPSFKTKQKKTNLFILESRVFSSFVFMK